MRRPTAPLALLFVTTTLVHAAAQDMAILKVEGRGIEGRPPYRGGGAVKFLDVSIGAQILHYQTEEELPLPLQITSIS